MKWNLDRVKNISEKLANELLNEFEPVNESIISTIDLGKRLHKIGVIKPLKGKIIFNDAEYAKKWGSYVGIFTSNGIGYTTISGKNVILHITPIALQFKNNEITYEKFMVALLSRGQIPKPNGTAYRSNEPCDKPFMKILKVLYLLYQHDKAQAWIDSFDIINHLEIVDYNCNYVTLYKDILGDRIKGKDRKITDKNDTRDIFMNKCISTNLIKKDKKRFYINYFKIHEINKIIIEQQSTFFTGEKNDWFDYFGGEVK